MFTTTELLDRMLGPVTEAFNEDAAQRLVDMRFDADLERHIDGLADLANEGQLSPEQRAEYDLILRVADVVSALRRKARQRLPSAASAA